MNLSIVVGTCDDYLEYMPDSIFLMDKYLPEGLTKIVAGETERVPTEGYEWYLPGKESWGKRMKGAIEKVETKYVFFTLDDYYYCQRLSSEFFDWLLIFMDREKANKLSLTPVPDFAGYKYTETVDTIKKMSLDSNWLTSVQPAIWRTDHLLKNLEDSYSPWDFEITGSEKLRHKEVGHYVMNLDEQVYFNFVRRGKNKTEGWENFLKQEGLS